MKTKEYRIKIRNMTITEKIIEAIKEKEVEINNKLHQDIFIEVRDSKVLVCWHKVLWKPKK